MSNTEYGIKKLRLQVGLHGPRDPNYVEAGR